MKAKKSIFENKFALPLIASIPNLLWGSAFPLIKVGYNLFDIAENDVGGQLVFAGIRFFISGLVLVLGICIAKRKLVLPKKKNWGRVISLGLVTTLLQYLLFYIGVAHTSGTSASIVDGTNVFLCVLVACFIFRTEKLTVAKVIGCVLGFAGVVVINLQDGGGLSFNLLGDGCILLSATTYAFAGSMLKKFAQHEDATVLTAYQFVAGGAIMAGIGFALGGTVNQVSASGVGVFSYLVMSSSVAYVLWNFALAHNPVSKVSIYGFLTPVFGVIFSAILLGEGQAFSVRSLLALVLILAGMVITLKEKKGAKV